MNERIRELVGQAAWKTRMTHNNAYWRMQEMLEDITWREKFAELIVRECIDIVSPYAVRMENFDGGHPIADLKKHFGVEE